MQANFKISKKEFQLEKQRHIECLSRHNFEIQLPSDYFMQETLDELREKGNWFEALENGSIKPITKRQYCFVNSLRKNDYSGTIGLTWYNYKRGLESWGDLYQILKMADD